MCIRDRYYALQAEFQGDKVAKNKADLVEIPKGAQGETKKKKDEEEITFRKDEKKAAPAAPKEEPKPAEEAPKPEPVVTAPAPVVAEVAQPDFVKIDAPELEGTTVVTKIDLSAIDSSTRPKKSAKKKDAKAEEETIAQEEVKPAKSKKKEEEIVEKAAEIAAPAPTPAPTPVHEEEAGPTIENIKADKLEGPKILGKIELPVNSDTRPKPMGRDEKRKRKRIPVDKKGDGPGGAQTGGGANQQGTVNRTDANGKPTGPNRPIVPALSLIHI